ncbi:MAG: histidine kinase, partial [Bacteroidota bacterium]
MNSFKFNKSDYQFIIIYFVGGSIWLLYRWNVEEYTAFEMITGLPGFIIKNLLLLYIFRWLINQYLVVRKNYVVFILLSFVAWEAVGFLDMWRDYYTAEPAWELPSLGMMLVENFYRSAADSVMLIGIILGKKYYENKLDYARLESAQKDLELKVLRAQYDPHFLYNSLNTIDALVEYSPKEKVKEYIAHLAALYRYLINTKDEDVVSLKEELGLARNYFYLIETRFENDYCFKVMEKEEPEANHLPNGSLLTALENVVKHNTAADGNTNSTQIIIEKNVVRIVNSLS